MFGSSVQIGSGSQGIIKKEWAASIEPVEALKEGANSLGHAGIEFFASFSSKSSEAYQSARDTLLKLKAGQEASSQDLADLIEIRAIRDPLSPVVTDALLHVASSGGNATEKLTGVVLSRLGDSEGCLDPFLRDLLVRATDSLSTDSVQLRELDVWLAKRVSIAIEHHEWDNLRSCRQLLQNALRPSEDGGLLLPESGRVFQKAIEESNQSVVKSLMLKGYDWLCNQDSKDHVLFAAMTVGSAVGLSLVCCLGTAAPYAPIGIAGGIVSGFFATNWLEQVRLQADSSERFKRDLAQLLEAWVVLILPFVVSRDEVSGCVQPHRDGC